MAVTCGHQIFWSFISRFDDLLPDKHGGVTMDPHWQTTIDLGGRSSAAHVAPRSAGARVAQWQWPSSGGRADLFRDGCHWDASVAPGDEQVNPHPARGRRGVGAAVLPATAAWVGSLMVECRASAQARYWPGSWSRPAWRTWITQWREHSGGASLVGDSGRMSRTLERHTGAFFGSFAAPSGFGGSRVL